VRVSAVASICLDPFSDFWVHLMIEIANTHQRTPPPTHTNVQYRFTTLQLWFAFLRLIFFAKIAENDMKNAQRLDELIGVIFMEEVRRDRKLLKTQNHEIVEAEKETHLNRIYVSPQPKMCFVRGN
jgi:hypothetical protein